MRRHICLLSNVGSALRRDWGEAVSWDRGVKLLLQLETTIPSLPIPNPVHRCIHDLDRDPDLDLSPPFLIPNWRAYAPSYSLKPPLFSQFFDHDQDHDHDHDDLLRAPSWILFPFSIPCHAVVLRRRRMCLSPSLSIKIRIKVYWRTEMSALRYSSSLSSPSLCASLLPPPARRRADALVLPTPPQGRE